MAQRRSSDRSKRSSGSPNKPKSSPKRAPSQQEEFQVRTDRPIKSVKLAAGKVPPWFRIFKAVVLNGLVREMTTADCKVLLCLGAFQSERNPWTVYPAVRTIAEMTGLKERAVYNAVNRLIELGIIKRESGGGRTANRYTLLPLAIDRDRNKRSQQIEYNNAEELTEEIEIAGVHRDAPLHDDAAVHDDAHVPDAAPLPRAQRSSSPARARSRYRRTDKEPSNRSEEAAAAEAALLARGVTEPTLSKLLDEHDPETIVRKCVDFDVRNRQPGKAKEPGWLVKSIVVGYGLHPATQKAIDREKKAAAKRVRDAELAAEADEEAERQAAVDAWVEEQLEQADDEEWDAWHAAVLERYPVVARNLRRSDPRTSPKLRGLIAGMLAGMYDLMAD